MEINVYKTPILRGKKCVSILTAYFWEKDNLQLLTIRGALNMIGISPKPETLGGIILHLLPSMRSIKLGLTKERNVHAKNSWY